MNDLSLFNRRQQPTGWLLRVAALLAVMSLAACGGGGGGTPTPNPGGNTLPSANAGADQDVNEGATVQLDGSGTDAEGAVTYSWTQTSGPAVTLSDPTIADPTFEAPQVATGSTETITLELTVTDGDGETATDSVTVTVNDVPSPVPVADAGPDQTVPSSAMVTLAGSASGSNPPFTYSWVQLSGTPVTLSDVSVADPSFTAPTVAAGNTESLTFELTVMDASGDTALDQIVVTVTDTPPVQRRIRRIDYDYDNNGTPDATATITYDAQGRVVMDEYLYTDDGTPDLFVLIRENQVTTEITYDANGRVDWHYRVDDDDGGAEFTYTYDPATGRLARADVVTTDLAGNVTSEVYFLYSYVGNQLTRSDGHLLANDMLLSSSLYTYDGNGRLYEDTGVAFNGTTQFVRRYNWDASGRLDLYEFDGNGDGVFEATYDYVFDATTGRLAQRINSNTSSFAQPYDNYTETFTYDNTGLIEMVEYDQSHDGSIDAVAVAGDHENASCMATYIPFLIPSVGQDGIPSSNVGDFAWCQ